MSQKKLQVIPGREWWDTFLLPSSSSSFSFAAPVLQQTNNRGRDLQKLHLFQEKWSHH